MRFPPPRRRGHLRLLGAARLVCRPAFPARLAGQAAPLSVAAGGGPAAVGSRAGDGGCRRALGAASGGHADDPRAGGVCQAMVGDRGGVSRRCWRRSTRLRSALRRRSTPIQCWCWRAAWRWRWPCDGAGSGAAFWLGVAIMTKQQGLLFVPLGHGGCAVQRELERPGRKPQMRRGAPGRRPLVALACWRPDAGRAADFLLGQPAVGGGAVAVGFGGDQRRRRGAAAASAWVGRAEGWAGAAWYLLASPGSMGRLRLRAHVAVVGSWRRRDRGRLGCRR